MPLTPGTRVGAYEVVSQLGAGGMGEVYKARDMRLDRLVAIKTLPDLMAADAERVARFEREGKVLAALNHPHIAGIFGVEESAGSRYLILEYVDGQSLADRLAGGALPFAEAMAIARQILDALEAAHDKGIVHRDLKPANVMLDADGRAKVLDFGLARIVEADTAADAANSPTMTAMPTQMGMILGTAAYMAPEQAKGRAADKRSDIWAFGCMFYEMLTGKRLFQGEDVTEILAAVIRDQPDWTALPRDVPAQVRTVLERCLERDRKARIPEASAVRFLLDNAVTQQATGPAPSRVATSAVRGGRLLPWIAAIVLAAATGLAVWRFKPSPPLPVIRFSFAADEQGFSNPGRHVLAISPDGTRIVYNAASHLNVFSLSEGTAKPIPGTDAFSGVSEPVFSPDGQSIAFWASIDQTIKRIAVTGGTASTICQAANPFGMNWTADGLVFGEGPRGIVRASDNGGREVIVQVKEEELAHGPQLLPGGSAVLFTVATGRVMTRWDSAQVVVQPLPSGARKVLVQGASDARYLPSGHLLYVTGGTLIARRFDPKRLELQGPPVPVIEGVRLAASITGAAFYSVSNTGTLVYVPGRSGAGAGMVDLALYGQDGAAQPLGLLPGPYLFPRVSPDGKRIAFETEDEKDTSIWTYDLTGGKAMQRLTFGGRNRYPAWSPDGKRIAFQSDRNGDQAIFWQPADGGGTAERLTTPGPGESHAPNVFTPAGDLLFDVTKGPDVSLWSRAPRDGRVTAFGGVRSTYPTGAVVSPDGRWVAYVSNYDEGKLNDQGASRIYVQPNPPTGAKYQLFARESDQPWAVSWSPDGRSLFYVPRAAGLFDEVAVITQPVFGFGNPKQIPRPFNLNGPIAHREYDVTADGKFLAVIAPGVTGGAAQPRASFNVVLNWVQELNAKVP